MNSEIEIFKNDEFKDIRTMMIDDEPWFVGKDIAENLGYANTRKAIIDHVDEEDKNTVTIRDGIQGNPNQTIINESGLYSLVLSSKLASAKRFKRWVTSEVLPTIRRHGMYAKDELLDNPDILISALEELKKERAEKAILKQQNMELQAKASYYDIILNCKDAVAVSVIAKDYGMSAKKLNKLLHELKVQYKQGNIWLLYQKYAEKGYTCTKTHAYLGSNGEMDSSVHTYWTQKGRLFIYDLLKSKGYVPLIEKSEVA